MQEIARAEFLSLISCTVCVQVKRKADSMDATPELSDSEPPLKQSKPLGTALKIKLKMPRPTRQP